MKPISNKRKKYLKLLRKIELIKISRFSFESEIKPTFSPDFFLSWREVEAKARGEKC